MWQNIETNISTDQQKDMPMLMPTPSAPWSLNTMPWQLASTNPDAGVMHFHAQNPEPRLHQKRKSDLAYESPSKQFISEEKITAHFNGMHISSNYIANSPNFEEPGSSCSNQNGKSFTNLTYQDYQMTAKELEEKLKRASRITMCDAVKKRIDDEQRKLTLLPDRLINRLEEPCRALVLWQPSPVLNLIDHEHVTNDGARVQREAAETIGNPPDADIEEDFENNNSCMMDFNNPNPDGCMEL